MKNTTTDQQRIAIENFLRNFPLDATSWAQATDEIRSLVHEIRINHNDYFEEQIESMNWYSFTSPSQWNTEGRLEFWRIWDLTCEEARSDTYNAFIEWFE